MTFTRLVISIVIIILEFPESRLSQLFLHQEEANSGNFYPK